MVETVACFKLHNMVNQDSSVCNVRADVTVVDGSNPSGAV